MPVSRKRKVSRNKQRAIRRKRAALARDARRSAQMAEFRRIEGTLRK